MSEKRAFAVVGVNTELRHPSEWVTAARLAELQRWLGPGRPDLDIRGIRGYDESNGGYLGFLVKELKRLTGQHYKSCPLLSAEENAEIRQHDIAATKREIDKYRSRLKELELSADQVAHYLRACRAELVSRLRQQSLMDEALPDDPGMRLVETGLRAKLQHDIRALRAVIGRYERLLDDLRPN